MSRFDDLIEIEKQTENAFQNNKHLFSKNKIEQVLVKRFWKIRNLENTKIDNFTMILLWVIRTYKEDIINELIKDKKTRDMISRSSQVDELLNLDNFKTWLYLKSIKKESLISNFIEKNG